ncbi:mRNA splicing factor [Gorgonomyces haynaldii]|nr:mRNA splicing factor [Gorgonomyces haynaldii]
MELASEERKKRLEALKQKKELRFRTYEPTDEHLKQHKQEAPKIGPKANEVEETIEVMTKRIHEEAMEEEQNIKSELDLSNLAPKKPNWDLKRELEPKLEKLERQLAVAITDLIRERLRAQKDISQTQYLEKPVHE